MIDAEDNNASAIIEAARELGKSETERPQQTKIGNLDVLVRRDGTVLSLERYADNPRRKRAAVNLYEAKSFIDYVNSHKVAGRTHLFGVANELGGSFTAVLDYHEGEEVKNEEGLGALPGWGEHKAVLTLETTPEWKRWIANNGKLLTQEQFAEFIEDNQLDIIAPAAADILDMAQLLQGKKTVNFRGGKNLKNGAIQLEYTEAVEVTGSGVTSRRDDAMQIPDKFTLGIIPFVGAFGVQIDARLRFRIGDGGKLSFAYILNRPYKVIEDAFRFTRQEIEQATKISVLLGGASIGSASV